MFSKPTKYGKIFHCFPFSSRQSIVIFEGEHTLSIKLCIDKKPTELSYCISLKNNSIRAYVLENKNNSQYNYNQAVELPIQQINLCNTHDLGLGLQRWCKAGFKKENDYTGIRGDWWKKGSGVHSSIVKLVYNKVNKISTLPEIDCKKLFVSDILKLGAYPLVRLAYIEKGIINKNLPPIFSPIFRHSTSLKEFAKNMWCGEKYDFLMRKIGENLINEEKDWNEVVLAYVLRGFIPFEYYKEIIDKQNSNISTPCLFDFGKRYRMYRMFFKQFKPKVIKELFNYKSKYEEKHYNGYEFFDTINMWNDFNDKIPLPRHFKNINDIHDYYSEEIGKLKHRDFDLPIHHSIKNLENHALEEFQFVIPKTNHELIKWGTVMHNCIGSYGMRVGKNCVLLGVKKGDELVYNIEIWKGTLHQFLGKRNSQPEEKDKERVINYLSKLGIVTKEERW